MLIKGIDCYLFIDVFRSINDLKVLVGFYINWIVIKCGVEYLFLGRFLRFYVWYEYDIYLDVFFLK